MILGSSIDPSLFSNDYSGFANAGAIRGQATAQLGKDIAGAVTSAAGAYQGMKQMQGQTDAFGKSMDSMAKAFPEHSEMFTTAKSSVMDPSASLIERAARMNQFSNQFSMMNQMQAQANADKLLSARLGGTIGGGTQQSSFTPQGTTSKP